MDLQELGSVLGQGLSGIQLLLSGCKDHLHLFLECMYILPSHIRTISYQAISNLCLIWFCLEYVRVTCSSNIWEDHLGEFEILAEIPHLNYCP